jgi:hypothetical protein
MAGKAGRPKREDPVEVVFLRLPKDVMARVVRCTGMIEITQGVKLNKTEAFRCILEAGCKALEGRETPALVPVGQQSRTGPAFQRAQPSPTPTRISVPLIPGLLGQTAPAQKPISAISETSPGKISEISEMPLGTPLEIAEISSIPILKISEIAGDDVSVPGYGFPEDEDEIPAPASHTNSTGAPAPQPTTQPAIPLALEPAPKIAQPVPVPQAQETPSATAEPIGAQTLLVETPVHHGRPGISRETLQAIADERTLCEGLSIREFSQRLFDKGIYRAKAKDGRAVPVDHSRLRRWLDQAREAGLL